MNIGRTVLASIPSDKLSFEDIQLNKQYIGSNHFLLRKFNKLELIEFRF